MRGYPSCLQGRRPSPCSNRVGSHIALFRGLHGVHLRCGLPARRAAKAARCLEGFDGFVTSAAAPIATGWSDQFSGRDSHPLKIRAFFTAHCYRNPYTGFHLTARVTHRVRGPELEVPAGFVVLSIEVLGARVAGPGARLE